MKYGLNGLSLQSNLNKGKKSESRIDKRVYCTTSTDVGEW